MPESLRCFAAGAGRGSLSRAADFLQKSRLAATAFQGGYRLSESGRPAVFGFGISGHFFRGSQHGLARGGGAPPCGNGHGTGGDHIPERPSYSLSFGQKKRVAFAGIMVMQPEVIILDEPTAGLDPVGISELMHLLQDVCRQQHTTIILSTHDIDVVPIYADVIDVMDKGHMVAHGTPAEIFAQPELLREHHLRLPRISHLLEILHKEDHWDVDASVSTISGARKELLRHAAE